MKDQLIELHTKLCAELGIPAARIRFCKRSRFPGRCGLYSIRRQLITIYLETCRIYKYDPREAMAHETAHRFQHLKGWFGEDKTAWKGTHITKFYDTPYHELPWEVQADEYADYISERENWE